MVNLYDKTYFYSVVVGAIDASVVREMDAAVHTMCPLKRIMLHVYSI